MVKDTSKDSLFSVELPDGTVLDYPAVFEAAHLAKPGEDPVKIKMLPVNAGVEEQAFLLIGELISVIPDLEQSLASFSTDGIKGFRQSLTITKVVGMVRAGVEKAPDLLIRLGAVLSELDEDGVRAKLTLSELVAMISPVFFLEKYRFTASMGTILEGLGFDLDEIDDEEEPEVVTAAELEATKLELVTPVDESEPFAADESEGVAEAEPFA
jgi:hypothetical protein